MRRDRVRGIYAIVDPTAGKGRDPLGLAATVLAAGVSVLQLRAKTMPAGEMLALARAMARLCREQGAAFIVNDRADVALAAGADGVHLGQDDLPTAVARGLAPPEFIIGVSTHSPEEATAAQRAGADYVAFGAMYPTATKSQVTAPQGPERLKAVVEAVRLPVIAIGGITLARLPEIKAAGAAGAAVISAIIGAPDPGAAAAKMLAAWQQAGGANY